MLTRQQRDTRDGLMFEYWLATPDGPLRARLRGQRAVFFVPSQVPTRAGTRRTLHLRTPDHAAVDAVYFHSARDLRDERERLSLAGTPAFEADVRACERHLMERFITGSCSVRGLRTRSDGYWQAEQPELRACAYTPQLKAASFDIETDGFAGALLSIAMVCGDRERVFMLGEGPASEHTQWCASEGELIRRFCAAVRELDPDLLLGWNVIEFDCDFLLRRAQQLRVPLALGRDGSELELTDGKPQRARVAGRVVLDGIGSLRAASHMLESYTLQAVAEHFLGRGKAIADHATSGQQRMEEIRRMFREDRAALARYNLEDCRLVRDIFERADLIGFLVQREQLTGVPLDRTRGAVAALDYLYLPRLHRAGFVAPTIGDTVEVSSSPGGYVLDSLPGLYGDVIVLDFKSLYPSIIRTFCIDPLALWSAADPAASGEHVAGFSGAQFDRHKHILPALITQLWQSRDEAKRRNDSARSYAIKILMNSFYGVLGTPACRFFDPKLASSITLRGHEIITRSRVFLEAAGHTVIYGDTDSLFLRVLPARDPAACEALGQQLAAALNAYWRDAIAREHQLESQLEVEFDTHYLRFFMPTLRDSNQGSKKRYAGLTRTASGFAVAFTGLEAVRTDWTPLARRFQRELYRRVFMDEPYVPFIEEIVAQLRSGQLDHELVYRKRLRRELDAYVKNVPPHVRAARQLGEATRDIAYCMTVRGPEPASERSSAFDYRHYLERQLLPAADGLLQHLGTSMARIIDPQLPLF